MATPQSSAMATPRGAKPKISDKLNPKTIDPFAAAKKKSAFASVYSNGGIPCRLSHGSVKHKLSWDSPREDLAFDPLLVTLAEGIREKVHPYMFVARHGFRELLETPDAADKTIPLLTRIVPAVRLALVDPDASVFEAGLDATVQLSAVVGPHLNPHLKNLLQGVSRRSLEKKYKDRITESLHSIEENGGKEALAAIKAKVPQYVSIYT